MTKKLQKSDYFFILALLAGLLMHMLCIYTPDHFADETFHASIPLRLINGDSLVQDEWHLTQFSAIFLYLPVRIWLACTGSTEGIILFLRFLYLVVHTITAVGLYAFFRKQGIWAIAASLLFYTQVPLRFLNANYHSLLALSLLFFTISLLMIYKKEHVFFYLSAGFFYFCGCVCNPFDCILFVLYGVICIIWSVQKRKYKKESEIRDRFFGGKAFLKFSAGVAIAVAICIAFFFSTGATISGLIENIPNLLTDTGHDIFSSPMQAFLEKIQITAGHFNNISFGLPFLLPAFYIALFFDKKRKEEKHKLIYILLALVMAIFYTVGVTVGALGNSRALALSLPLFILSSVCYILTEHKNKKLFYCMWLPSVFAVIAQYLASDLHLSVLWVLTVANIAGIFFVKDFLAEVPPIKNFGAICKNVLCVGICLQLAFQCCIYSWGRVVDLDNSVKVEQGPYAGFYMNQATYSNNISMMQDLDLIKERSQPDDAVLIISEFTWMYLYIDRPFATYSPWQPWMEADRLKTYYEINPDKTPDYIYIGWVYIPTGVTTGHVINPDRAQLDADVLKKMFSVEQENLSCGILLTVKE